MSNPIYTDWWPESWGPFGRGAAAGMIVGNVVALPLLLATVSRVQWNTPDWPVFAAMIWFIGSGFFLLRASDRRLIAEREKALAALAERHAAETTMYDEWVAECRRYLAKEVQR